MRVTESCLGCGAQITLEGDNVVELLVAWDKQHQTCRDELAGRDSNTRHLD